MGTVVTGKLQSGTVTKGQTLLMMPNKVKVVVDTVVVDDAEHNSAQSGSSFLLFVCFLSLFFFFLSRLCQSLEGTYLVQRLLAIITELMPIGTTRR
jgi:hypothetical protein